MGIMSFLRNKAGAILVFGIGFAIVAFLIGDVVRTGTPFWQANQNVVGKIGGESIDIKDFNEKVEQTTANYRQQMGGNLNPQMTSYIVENTWNQTVSEILLDREVKRLGLEVGRTEINDMLTGKNPAQQVVQNFGDPKTGVVNVAQLNKFRGDIESQPTGSPGLAQWQAFLVGLKKERLNQKYFNLIKNSLYVTSLEAREDYMQRNKIADFSYVALDYTSIPDNQVKITDDDYKEYYEENKQLFKNAEETRSFKYVVFDAKPSATDSAEMKSRIDKMATEFRAATNDSLFVSINSDTRSPVTYVRKGQLDPALDSVAFKSPAGTFIGPVFSNGTYKMAKVIDVKMVADSAKSAHILVNPTAEGGLDRAKAKADSIANLIRKGADFAELAKKFGTDGTKDKSGDLGYYAYGAQGLDKDYNEAIFSGKVGDLKVITSQYGVHVIKIQDQRGSSKVAKVAVIDKALTSSNKTQQAIYAKAAAFLGSIGDGENFEEKTKKQGLQALDAADVTATQSSVPGLENARELVRWVFKADKGKVSEQVYSFNDKYVVAKVTQIKEEGIPPVEQVKPAIEPKVRDLVKSRMLTEKIEKALAGASSINAIAQKLGKQAFPVQNVVFANPIIPNAGQENKVIGTVFGLNPGKMYKNSIIGEKGVYVVALNKFTNPAPLTNTYQQKTQMMKTLGQQAQGQAFRVLRDNGNVKDYRGKFF